MKVRFLHLRRPNTDGKVAPKGGVTIAYQVDDMDQVHRWAFARCSHGDVYNKRIGRAKAGGRLNSKRLSRQVLPVAYKAFVASVTTLFEKQLRSDE